MNVSDAVTASAIPALSSGGVQASIAVSLIAQSDSSAASQVAILFQDANVGHSIDTYA